MTDEIQLRVNLFGYNILVREGSQYVALKGQGHPDLRLGMTITLLGDSRGYVPSGFEPGEEVTIVGFREPFEGGESDHIIKVTNGSNTGSIKPSNVQRNIVATKEPANAEDARHQRLRGTVHTAIADLLDAVYLSMSQEERRGLPSELAPYVNAIVRHELERLPRFGDALAHTVARVYAESPHGERFLEDPVRSNEIVNACLFLDRKEQLISVKNPVIVWSPATPPCVLLQRYESYEVLTGPEGGRRFSWRQDALGEPSYPPKATRTESEGAAPLRQIRIFLASSAELRGDRDEFDLYFRQQNDRYLKRGYYLEIPRWETLSAAVSKTRQQDEYDKVVRECDVFVCLFFTKAGTFTQEEFEAALRRFRETGRPRIYTFFKKAKISIDAASREDLQSLWAFQERLKALGHFYSTYDTVEQLKLQFRDQLDVLVEESN